MTIYWRYWVHEQQKFVADADQYLTLNPTHQITERFVDDAHPAGISGEYIPDDTFVYVRVDGDLYELSISGNDVTITPSGGSPSIAGSGTYLPLAGGTMTGDLILDHDPVQDLEAATKQYVDGAVISGSDLASYSGYAEGAFVNVSGDTMTGFLTLNADPTASGHAANKNYVDNSNSTLSGSLSSEITSEISTYSGYAEGAFVNISGDTMTGFLTLSADPTASGHAANKNYVDAAVQSGIDASNIEVKDDNVQVVAEAKSLDFGHALDVSASGTEAEIVVDESEFTTVVFLTGNQTIAGEKTFVDNTVFNGDVQIDGDLTVTGSVTTINTTELLVEDNIITLNSTHSGAPSLNAGIEVERGSETDARLIWNETTDQWEAGISGSTEKIILQSDLDTAVSGLGDDLIAYSGYAEGAFVNVSGDTMTGFLTLNADPTASGHAANKNYVDSQVSAAQPTVQVDFTTGTDLDTTQNTLPLSGTTAVNPTGTVYTVNANDISIGQTGFYKVTWSVECQKTGGSTQRRLLQTNINHNGSQLDATTASCSVRDATNNHGSASNSYVIEVTAGGQTVGIRSRQTGSGGGASVVFDLSAGHLLIERVGDN